LTTKQIAVFQHNKHIKENTTFGKFPFAIHLLIIAIYQLKYLRLLETNQKF
jgi:hypothetical protein